MNKLYGQDFNLWLEEIAIAKASFVNSNLSDSSSNSSKIRAREALSIRVMVCLSDPVSVCFGVFFEGCRSLSFATVEIF